MSERKLWTVYNNFNDNGPHMVLIIDCEWWDEHWEEIDEWFDKNCPDSKPEKNDTIITFVDRSSFAIWKFAWDQIYS